MLSGLDRHTGRAGGGGGRSLIDAKMTTRALCIVARNDTQLVKKIHINSSKWEIDIPVVHVRTPLAYIPRVMYVSKMIYPAV